MSTLPHFHRSTCPQVYTSTGPHFHMWTCPHVHRSTGPHVHTSTSKISTRTESWKRVLSRLDKMVRRTVFFKLILQLSVIVLSFVVNTFWVSVKKESYNYKQEVVNQYSTGVPPFVVEPPPLWFRLCSSQRAPDPFHFIRPRLILWDPICQRH